MKRSIVAAVFAAAASICVAGVAQAAIVITEVHPTGSSASYSNDWFELTNTGTTAVDITGWKYDDSSANPSLAATFRGVTSIGPGQSVIFYEGNDDGSDDDEDTGLFIDAWFGGTAPAGFLIGAYGGSGLGLSAGGDAVNIYDASDTLVASVSFGSSTAGVTFDNAAGASGLISTLSVVGVNGAFTSVIGGEIGSPGTIGAIPEPAAAGLLLPAMALVARRRRA